MEGIERLFLKLPDNEKQYWTPHNYDIFSGAAYTPGLPEFIEKIFYTEHVNTYGKGFR